MCQEKAKLTHAINTSEQICVNMAMGDGVISECGNKWLVSGKQGISVAEQHPECSVFSPAAVR